MKQATRLAGQSGFFLAGNIFTLLAGFPFQILLAKHLGASGLGIFGLLDSGVQLLCGLLGFGVAQTLVRYIPHHIELGEFGSVRKLIMRGLGILLTAGLVGYGAILISVPLITRWWPDLAALENSIRVMGIMLPLGLILFFCTQSLRGFFDIRFMVFGSSFLQLTAKIGLTVVLFSLGFSLLGYIWAIVISTGLAIAWMAFGLARHLRGVNNTDPLACTDDDSKKWTSYARVMYSGSLLGIVSAPLDKFLLGYFLNASSVGVLMVAKTLQQLPGIFLQMFIAVVSPMLSAAHARGDKEKRQHLYSLTTDWLVRLSLPLFIFLWIFSIPVLGLFGPDFAEKGRLSFLILLFGQLINILTGPLGNLLNMSGLEGPMFRTSLVQTVFIVVLLPLLIILYGLEGAAWGSSFAMIFPNLIALWIAKKHLALQWWERRYIKWLFPSLNCALIGLLAYAYLPSPNAASLFGILAGLYIVFHGIYLLAGLNADDHEVWDALQSKLFGRTL